MHALHFLIAGIAAGTWRDLRHATIAATDGARPSEIVVRIFYLRRRINQPEIGRADNALGNDPWRESRMDLMTRGSESASIAWWV
jgi:hypothetical protein